MKTMELWKSIQGEHKEFLCDLYEHYDYNKDVIKMENYLACIEERIPEASSIRKRPFRVNFKCTDGSLRVTIKRGRKCLLFKPEIIWNASKKQLESKRR